MFSFCTQLSAAVVFFCEQMDGLDGVINPRGLTTTSATVVTGSIVVMSVVNVVINIEVTKDVDCVVAVKTLVAPSTVVVLVTLGLDC